MRAYVDSDILIWHLRGEKRALSFLQDLQKNHDYEMWIGALQRAEVVFFMKTEEEENTLLMFSQFKTAPVDQACIDLAGKLYRKWNPSHGLDINDAILAALAMQTGGKVFCLNKKHYPMPEVIVERPW